MGCWTSARTKRIRPGSCRTCNRVDRHGITQVLRRFYQNPNNRHHSGQAFTLEWAASYAVSKTVDVGAVGYYQQQVTEDHGQGASSERDRVAGVGPEVSVFYPSYTLGWSLRYAYEFMAESRLQGHTVALTITKRF